MSAEPFLLSIIVPTYQREKEFKRFMDALAQQNQLSSFLHEIELIIVDQNADERVTKNIHRVEGLALKYVRLKPEGVSKAKNYGIAEASGQFCFFPDDDCWFSSAMLAQVMNRLRGLLPSEGLLINSLTPDSRPLLPHKLSENFSLSQKNIKQSFYVPQIGQIYPTTVCKQLKGFNVALGTGIRLGSAEETDFLVRVVKSGIKFVYDQNIHIHHPPVDYQSMTPEKSYKYGLGFGAFCRIHQWHGYWALKILRSFGGMFLNLFKDRQVALSYWETLKGRWVGYWSVVGK